MALTPSIRPVSYTHLDVYKRQGENTETSIPGVYAVGDVRTKLLRQIVTAVAVSYTHLEDCTAGFRGET